MVDEIAHYTKKMGYLCCIKLNDDKMKESEDEKRRRKKKKKKKEKMPLKDKNISPKDEKKKGMRKKKPKKFWKKREQNKSNQLALLVNKMSFRSDSSKKRYAAEEIMRIGNSNIAARVFTFRELAAATEIFNDDNLLGEGGFGRVYKGQLRDTNEVVAVKQLDRNGFQGNREFLVEVLMLSLLHHQNLVKLLGYCADGDQRILVYEYMPLGSLEDHLLDLEPKNKPMDWHTRMKIAAGAAKGLEYLHDTANPPIIYRDFKASNILLDKNYNPKLSDFGLARVGPVGDKNYVSTRVMGTYGYCAPEYALTGQLTKMSDVYSFGVVFLEIITGRRAIDTSRPTQEQLLIQWAEPLIKDRRKFVELADPLLQDKYPVKGLYQALAVAAMCLQEEASIRPRISDVVTALEYLADPNYDAVNAEKESVPGSMPSSSSEIQATEKDDEENIKSILKSHPESKLETWR